MLKLEQQRAKFALEQVERVKQSPKAAKFKTQLLKLPARLHNNGLGQTVGYLLAQKPDSPEREVYTWLEKWLKQGHAGVYARGTLIECLTGAKASDLGETEIEPKYRRASAEARALANWLKRFAEAFIQGEAE